MTEKRKDYLSPRMKVIKVAAHQMLCDSNGTKSIYEEELDNNSFYEQ